MLGFISLIWETPFLVFYKLLSVQANSRYHNFKWYQYLLSIEIHIYMQDNLKHLMNIKHLSWQFPQAQNNHCLFIKIKYLYLIIMVHDMHEVRLSLHSTCTQSTLPFQARNLPASSNIQSLYMFLPPWFINFTCPCTCIYTTVCFCLLYRSIYYKPHSSLFVYSTCPNITYLTVYTSIFVYFTCKNIMYLTVRYCILYLHVHILHTSQLVARAAPWIQFLSFLSSFLRSRFLGVRM